MNTQRSLSSEERSVISTLLNSTKDSYRLIESLERLGVFEMNDGGMGSLSLVPNGLENTARTFGTSIAECVFKDADGIDVTMTINVDGNGDLFECDVWKTDFSPLQKWPEATDIQVR